MIGKKKPRNAGQVVRALNLRDGQVELPARLLVMTGVKSESSAVVKNLSIIIADDALFLAIPVAFFQRLAFVEVFFATD